MYQYIVFDLDGTLSDSSQGITKSVEYALQYYNIKVEDRKELEVFIDPPMEEQFMASFDFTKEKAIQAKLKSREYFATKGIWENELYTGVEEVLKNLKQKNKKIILATSKPEIYAKQILEQHQIISYFDYIAGATLDGTRSKKRDVIFYALQQSNISDKKACIMIGDTKHDILGARENEIDSIGVLYGFGSQEELEMANPTYLVKEIIDILQII